MMQPWFEKAKLGIFIHWGIYAVDGRGGESWPITRGEVSYNDYMKQMDHFGAKAYDPEAWADLIVRSGAKYAVLTTKHHDGVTLWPTAEPGPCISRDTDAGDLVAPYIKAIRDRGIHTGLYFSHTDWSHQEHFEVITGKTGEELTVLRDQITAFRYDWADSFKEDYDRNDPIVKDKWQVFLDFEKRQIKELLTNYGTIDLLWFDVMLHRPGYDYKCRLLRDYIYDLSPKTVINSRLESYGDYETPEQFIPVYPPEGPWEACLTTNDTWSYTGNEKAYKSAFEIITMFCECLSMGGNMLLNIGPDSQGNIPEAQVTLLETLGQWIDRNEESVYTSRRGLPMGYAYGMTSLSESEDVIYVYLSHLPKGTTSVKGIRNEIKAVTVLASGESCGFKRIGGAPWLNVPGNLWIELPKEGLDPYVTVLKIELEGALDLHEGLGIEIDVN